MKQSHRKLAFCFRCDKGYDPLLQDNSCRTEHAPLDPRNTSAIVQQMKRADPAWKAWFKKARE